MLGKAVARSQAKNVPRRSRQEHSEIGVASRRFPGRLSIGFNPQWRSRGFLRAKRADLHNLVSGFARSGSRFR